MIGEDPLDLQGQVAFVTGAGQGLGREIGLALARHNAGGIAVNDFVEERAASVAEEIRALGVPAVPVAADVGNSDSVRAAVESAEKALGPATILVNNAGNAGPETRMGFSPLFWESDPADWDKFFHTNLFGVMNCAHALLPRMVELKRGRVVTIISDAGRIGEARLAAYSAAKAGAAGFVRAIAREAGKHGVTANAISLSTLEPPFDEEQMAQWLEDERTRAQLSRYALRRFGKPAEVANMVLFLCSDAAAWITGQTYPVNGGYSFAQ